MDLIRDSWTMKDYDNFLQYLDSMKDLKYRSFHKGLVPNLEDFIGLRVPIMRDTARKISKGNYSDFIKLNRHKYYEEIMIHGLIIGYIKLDFTKKLEMLDNYLNYVDNWAICDSVCSNLKDFKKHQERGFDKIINYINSSNKWINRVGLVLLLNHYINDDYIDKVLDISESINSSEYYVKMANAWLISVCATKYPEKTYNKLKNSKLDSWTINKAISKINDSYKINKIEKEKFRKIKRIIK